MLTRVLWILLFLAVPSLADAAEADLYCLTGTSSTGTPIFKPASATDPCPVSASVSASTTATASAAPTPVLAGTGKPLNIDLFSSLFVNCAVGCSGGPADESAFTFGTTPTTSGGVFQTTPTNNKLTNGQIGSVQMTDTRAFFINLRNVAGTEIGTVGAPLQVSLANTGANATGILVTGAGGTFPVTQSTSPWIIAGAGTAGTAATGVATIQGIAGMTKLLVTPDSVALPANQSVNVSQINGVTPLMGNGVTGTGSPRVTVASDNTPFGVKIDQTTPGTTNAVSATNFPTTAALGHGTAATALRVELPTDGTGIVGLATGSNTIGALTANQSVNVTQVAGGAVPSLGTGIQGTTPAPTSTAAAGIAPAVDGSAVSSKVLKAGAGNLYSVYATCSAACWLMVFNATSAPSNGSTTAGVASGNMQHCVPIASNDARSISYSGMPPEVFTVGITAVISSTACATLTLATTGFIHGSVQ